jgi:hypothetical protein
MGGSCGAPEQRPELSPAYQRLALRTHLAKHREDKRTRDTNQLEFTFRDDSKQWRRPCGQEVVTMTQASSANWEIAIVLPLGVVDNQLRRIEEQLRLVNMKALDFGKEHENWTLRRLIGARLEHVSELLDSIARLVSDIDADMQPRATNATRRPRGTDATTDDIRQSQDGVAPGSAMRKANPAQDD